MRGQSEVHWSRREFLSRSLKAGAALGVAGAAGDWLFAGETAPLIPGKERLIVRSQRFLDLEMPVSEISSWITPVDLHFVRNHVSEPVEFDLESWRLKVSGEVEHPLELSYADLGKLEPASVVNTLECAGNGRRFHNPHVPGVQWGRGAMGNARWTGPRLKDVLNRAGLKTTAKHVSFRGLEEPPGKVPQFIRSIPIEKALDSDTLLAMKMNGSTIPKHHGYPVRGLVPGWIGAASCKWLSEIKVLDKEFDGNFMNPAYRMPIHPVEPGGAVKPEDTRPAAALNVKSVIALADKSTLKARPTKITGAAWAGEADVVKVEVSTDGGETWQPAQLGSDHAKYAWRLWSYAWHPKAGSYTLMARATDSQGRVQPKTAPWNPSGYLWNGYDQVTVQVNA